MDTQPQLGAIEDQYEDYVMGVQCRLKMTRIEAQDALHEYLLNYMDPEYHDQFKYQNGQIILFDQYLVKRCAQASQKEIPCET